MPPADVLPRILLHYPVLNAGGAERSTLRLLSALAERGCEVHLVLTVAGGRLESEIDPRVVVHHLRDTVGSIPRRVRSPRDAWRFLSGVLQWGRGRLQQVARERRFRGMRFDAAIAGLHGLSPAFVCGLAARRRLVMVRNDVADDRRGKFARNIAGYADRVDQYVCVSQSVLDSLVGRFPQTRAKAVRIYNLIDPEAMRRAAAAGTNPFGDAAPALRILSVCRLQESQKALLRMVEVHRRLIDAGLRHEWHVLGDGPDRALLEQEITLQGVAATLILHGAVANPFPWYRYADLVAVLSRYEGLCGVVNEARVLERPVIATRFAGIEEQIESGVNGLIVEQETDAIVEGMRRLLQDPVLRSRLAAGGYSDAFMDDGAKIDAMLALVATPQVAGGSRW
jgi:glycosyltransferase involved in cell wall biosynthesis